jgi:subtilase family serine protease
VCIKISEGLRAHGFAAHASPSRMTIDFSGTAGQVREAFGTEIHAFDVKGVRHIANLAISCRATPNCSATSLR